MSRTHGIESEAAHEAAIAELIQLLGAGEQLYMMIFAADRLLMCADCRERYEDWLAPLAGANGAESIGEARHALETWQCLQDPAERAKADAEYRTWYEREGQHEAWSTGEEVPYGVDLSKKQPE